MAKQASPKGGVTLRAVLIGVLLLPMNIYLVVQWETVWGTQYPTTMSIFFNAVFCLFVVTLANFGLRRVVPRYAFSQGELLTMYCVLNAGIAVSGHDFSQTIFCTLGTAHWFATPENEWSTVFWRHVPEWTTVQDRSILQPLYEGDASVYDPGILLGWWRPMLWWTAFMTLIAFVALCLNSFVRRQWIEHEKLSYPLVELPFDLTLDNASAFFGRRSLWIGVCIAGGIDLLNGIATVVPTLPQVPMRVDLTAAFVERPWDAMSSFFIQWNPYAIGLAFAIPLDLLFSTWLFYFLWKAQRVMGSVVGVQTPGYPFPDQQLLGGYLAIGAVLLWTGRRYFVSVARKAVRLSADGRDSEEPMTHRFALWGGLAGTLCLVAMLYRAGMTFWFAFGFFAIYFGILFAFTRLRAEVGPPLLGIHYSGPIQLMVAGAGSRRVPIRSLTVAAPLWTHTKEIRDHPMPYQLESFKLAQKANMDTRRLWKVILVATAVAVPMTLVAFLQASYHYGGPGGWRGVAAYTHVERWVQTREGADIPFLLATLVGAVVVFVNTALRLRFVGWQLHPLGYLLAGYYHLDRLWTPFLIAWALKLLILRLGGIRGYRQALPFFLGLVLGEFIMGSVWGIVGLATGERMYAFKGW
ncbi:hypothetical protein HN371_20290 [Candidatus Poribacteria bacterium]|jgi:hypothetical protein|nr:hypothetical protein [Candidatus Poribacteria bacterium]MBT7096469.1 hypothetical protein [Candidatus Poribacteria bacterium]MBT7804123.1 hypothetical protein [Candidatus Poribacteria bacterium]